MCSTDLPLAPRVADRDRDRHRMNRSHGHSVTGASGLPYRLSPLSTWHSESSRYPSYQPQLHSALRGGTASQYLQLPLKVDLWTISRPPGLSVVTGLGNTLRP